MWGSHHSKTPHTLRKKPKRKQRIKRFNPKALGILKNNLAIVKLANLF